MSTRIPTSTSVLESALIESARSSVWHLIKLPDFAKFWTALAKSEGGVPGVSPETDVVKWTFKDGTVVEVKQEEHSVCDIWLGFITDHDYFLKSLIRFFS